MRVVAVLATSLDGRIAEAAAVPARFGSAQDQRRLETIVAQSDAVLMGAATLRAYGTCRSVTNPQLQQQRRDRGQSPQPVQIICSASGQIEPACRFFQQPVPRWLLTTEQGRDRWRQESGFEAVLIAGQTQLDWEQAFAQFDLSWQQIAVLGGGQLLGSLLAADRIDELYLTLCPLLLGDCPASPLVAGLHFSAADAPRWQLLSAEPVADELFLHYRCTESDAIGSKALTSAS
ncbi:RibD family protein [Synechococcus elongatus]|uniref:Riboflavin-specific deaminase n=2 Tax=Synechococcus elongatus TaxID=32046 RepID=Q31P03_SYNE7|nr:dihydrofolate reductase family protein [Synechococcus elongatus]ABB57216.1 putative riboflavin-specific deaminase [Synechococcus elongatus PCC 7942 = FACHB-805]AJD58271.1 riboflavin deaminase [Synechococcus elongatus UTEX 2973]MBD2587621.1 dihydrofolate reductase family protein [Synechococcus elongatus FACHB-242]MBD2688600.1 dihydrofolate reductase family protein [Synechococcus elongatus FACHB-1061]MBD2707671.1 dihydrofolate reductase family protein [Synechococcus elongatus PCC 7942 = FACHB